MKRAGPVVLLPIRGPISPASPVRHLYKAAASITPSGKERRQRRSRVGRAGVELSTIWLQGLVQGAGHELMLFAAVGILLIGLDDLLLDALWLAMRGRRDAEAGRSEEHTSELQSLMRSSYAVFGLKKKK